VDKEISNPQEELIAFLEEFPLYKKKDFPQPKYPGDSTVLPSRKSFSSSQLPVQEGFHLPLILRIEMPCVSSCGDKRTFASTAENRIVERALASLPQQYDVLEPGRTHRLSFICTHCQKHQVSFLVYVDHMKGGADDGFSLVKAGQWPSTRPKLTRPLERALGESAAPLYQKGLTAENHNFGIGAFAYYRRVAEDIIDKLLSDIRSYAEAHGAADLVKALDGVATETPASERIKIVKDLLPLSLRPDGLNPLGTIYQALSDGLHGQSDEHCLEHAEKLRFAIEFLVSTVEDQRASTSQYVAAMRGLQKAGQKKPAS
jgi:hypothetical protein